MFKFVLEWSRFECLSFMQTSALDTLLLETVES